MMRYLLVLTLVACARSGDGARDVVADAEQIAHGTGRHAIHLAELLHIALQSQNQTSRR